MSQTWYLPIPLAVFLYTYILLARGKRTVVKNLAIIAAAFLALVGTFLAAYQPIQSPIVNWLKTSVCTTGDEFCISIGVIISLALIDIAITAVFTIIALLVMIVIRRKGGIVVGSPATYSALAHTRDDFLLVRLPLIFNNKGDNPITVQRLRLSLTQRDKKSPTLHCDRVYSELESKQDDGEWHKQFVVKKDEPVSRVFQFHNKPRNGFLFSDGYCDAVLEGQFDGKPKWELMTRFKLYTPKRYLESLNGIMSPIPYDNYPKRYNPTSQKRA